MTNAKYFIQSSLLKLWEGFLSNIGVIVSAFLLAGGYLVVLNKLLAFQSWIRSIPTDYVLTPAIVLIAVVVVLLRINRKQKKQLNPARPASPAQADNGRFMTHFGVWWKIYEDSEYIEDFPYCVCCDPKKKLVQTQWHPDESYECPITKVAYKLYSGVPMELRQVLNGLYRSYFRGFPTKLADNYRSEMARLVALNPEMPQVDLTRTLFQMEPFCRIPHDELEAIFKRFTHPLAALHFVETNLHKYKQYMKVKKSRDEA